ncbi:hypothetical protein [Salinivirga cyanobacteriivorans]
MRFIRENIEIGFIIVLSGILLTSIAGLELHYFQCQNSGDAEFSISFAGEGDFPITNTLNCQCSLEQALNDSCKSCNSKASLRINDTDCCERTSTSIQLEVEYLYVSFLKLESPREISLSDIFTECLNETSDNQKDIQISSCPDWLPNPRYNGRFILIANNQLKIPSA